MALACLLCPASLGSLGEYAAHLQEDHRVHRLDVLNRMVGLQVQAEVKEEGLEENNQILESKVGPEEMVPLEEFSIKEGLRCDESMEDIVDKLEVVSEEGQIATEKSLTNMVKRKYVKGGKKCSDIGCEMVFKSFGALQNHKRAKHGAEKLKCKEEGCGREFKSLLGLNMHDQTIHKEQGFKCEEEGCGRWFMTRKRLEDHGRGQHGQAKLRCPEENCQGSFTTKGYLKVHLKKIHSKGLVKVGENPGARLLKCREPGCEIMLRNRRQVEDHERAQHGVEKLKCKVEDCGKEYTSQMGYNLHVKHGHNKIRCAIEGCGKKFFTGQLLQAHHMSRHGQAKLKCPEEGCFREFTQKPNLRTHIKVVHKMEQFGCDNCSSKFNTKRQLQDHGREEHGHPKLACRVESCAQLFDKASYFYHHMKAQHPK